MTKSATDLTLLSVPGIDFWHYRDTGEPGKRAVGGQAGMSWRHPEYPLPMAYGGSHHVSEED